MLQTQMYFPVADPDLQIKRAGGHPDPEIRGGGGAVFKKFFLALWASVWTQNKGGPPGLRGPSPGSATVSTHLWEEESNDWKYVWV